MDNPIIDLIARLSNLPPEDILLSLRAPLSYQSNRLYDARVGDQHWIVKEYLKPKEFDTAPHREFQALTLLAPWDIAPHPIHFEPTRSSTCPMVIYEFMPGEMWDRHVPTTQELEQLASVWLTMNGVAQAKLWFSRGFERSFDSLAPQVYAQLRRYADWVEAHYPSGQTAAKLCLRVVKKYARALDELSRYPTSFCFCQADSRFANVIWRPDQKLGLIDWEDSGLRDPAQDVADLMTHPNQEDLVSYSQWHSFLQPYTSGHTPSDPALLNRMRLYLALFPLFWLALLVDHGVNRALVGELAGWEVNALPANERLCRYLARCLAWPDPDFSDTLREIAELPFFPSE